MGVGLGIYRNVAGLCKWVHIAKWGAYAHPSAASAKKGTLEVEVEVVNESEKSETLTVVNELFNQKGEIVAKRRNQLSVAAGENATLSTALSVSNPSLWSVDHPYLYSLKTTLLKGS